MRSVALLVASASLSAAFNTSHRDIYHDTHGQDLRLAIASCLSEDSNTTVLVLVAGDTGDAIADSINVPVNAYYSGLPGTSYDWKYTTANQPNANNRVLPWPRGKVLGGSSAMNGMYTVRPSKLEVDTWANLIGDGGDKWNWDSLFTTMKESETFTPPSSDIQAEGGIKYEAASCGTSGPVHSSYPGYPTGQIEILLSLTGAPVDGSNTYLTHNADTVLREGLKLARKLGNTTPLSSAIGDEVTPGSSVQSDDDWDKWLANVIVSVSCVAVPVAVALLARQRPRAGAVYVQSVVRCIVPHPGTANAPASRRVVAKCARNSRRGRGLARGSKSTQPSPSTPSQASWHSKLRMQLAKYCVGPSGPCSAPISGTEGDLRGWVNAYVPLRGPNVESSGVESPGAA
ncbi:hypothetical protein VTO73DRAFT_13127 [Trametes versicolor]